MTSNSHLSCSLIWTPGKWAPSHLEIHKEVKLSPPKANSSAEINLSTKNVIPFLVLLLFLSRWSRIKKGGRGLKLSRTLWGSSWVEKPPLFVGKTVQLSSPSLSSTGQIIIKGVRECRNKQQCRHGAGSWLLLRVCITI